MNALKRTAFTLLTSLALLVPAGAQLSMDRIHITLGGGYLEQPETGYFAGQVGTTVRFCSPCARVRGSPCPG